MACLIRRALAATAGSGFFQLREALAQHKTQIRPRQPVDHAADPLLAVFSRDGDRKQQLLVTRTGQNDFVRQAEFPGSWFLCTELANLRACPSRKRFHQGWLRLQ